MKLLSLRGIHFRVNVFFLVLLFALAWTNRLIEGMTVFGVVLLHELGHVVTARGYGIDVQEVELLPFGGVARLEGLMELNPRIEAGIALAGPLTNVVLLAAGALLWRYEVVSGTWPMSFMATNVAVAGINLVPALPLDGGRLYRAYRSGRVGYRKATTEAVRLGKVLAVVLVVAGSALVYFGIAGVTLPVLGFFVFVAAGKEQESAQYVFMAHLARKQKELERLGCMTVETLAAGADTRLKHVVERFIPQKYHVIWIVDEEGRLTGVASERDVLQSLFEKGPEVPVKAIPQWQFIDRR